MIKIKSPRWRGFNVIILDLLFSGRKDSLFLEGSNCLRRKGHCYLLAVYNEGFSLEVRLKYAPGASQREANIAAKLLAFASEFALCCHYFFFHLLFNNLL